MACGHRPRRSRYSAMTQAITPAYRYGAAASVWSATISRLAASVSSHASAAAACSNGGSASSGLSGIGTAIRRCGRAARSARAAVAR